MVTTVLLRSITIFAVLLCCFQSSNSHKNLNGVKNQVDCELYPYHASCRGVMTKKRAEPPNIMRALECDDGDCRLSGMKFLMALLNKNLNKDDLYYYNPPGYDMHHKKEGARYGDRRSMMESLMSGMKNIDNDY